jgi:hypothetical protein
VERKKMSAFERSISRTRTPRPLRP